MALIKRMKEGDKSPTLYSWYGKQYDFDQLQKDADEGVHEYIATLKRGSKDIDQFMKAYSDIMTGIRDGSITFKDGKYVDARGRYSNGLYYDDKDVKQTSKKSSKDYYGLMANYIYGKQRSQNEYTAPEDKTKIKWAGSSSIGKAITRTIFNSDAWNNQDFQDLNEYDESGKVKGTDNRHKKLYDAFDYVLSNFDNLFSGYSEQDKANATKYISEAMNYLKDGKIDPGDYLALNRAASGLDYRSMFSDRTVETPSLREGAIQVPETDFVSWVSKKYPIFSGTLHTSRSLNDGRTYGPDTLNRITQAVNSLSESDLYRIVRSALADKNYVFNNEQSVVNTFGDADYQFSNPFGVRLALQSLKDRNLLKSFGAQQPDLYYIPNTDNNQRFTSWVWDAKNGTLSEMSYHDIPYWREKILAEWQSSKGTPSGDNSYWTSRYGSFKKGGVILAQTGVKLGKNANWYTGVFQPQLTHILEGLDKDKEYYSWLNDMQDRHNELYTAAGSDFLNKAYKADTVGTYQDLYKSGYQTEWNGNPAGYNSLGIANAQKLGMFDISGRTRTSGDWVGKWNTDNLYSGITDYRRLLGRKGDYTDEQLASTVASFKEKGYDFVEDANGYYKLIPIEEHVEETEKPEEPTVETPQDKEDSFINPISQPTKSPNQFGNFISQLAPDLIGAGRLFGSLRTNNKVAETVRKSLTPVLKNTYELYSPVTGAFSEMQLRNSQAADVRRQAARPFTSDASLQLAGALDANRQATNLERQGFLADDAEIKRTKAEALKRQEDNIARRSEVANFNRASINQTNRELAQLEGARLKQNWQSVDNFLAGLEGRVRQRTEIDRERRLNFGLQTAQQDIDDQYYKALQKAQDAALKWQKDPANASKTLSEMPNYFQFLRELSRWRNASSLGAHANVYGYRYDNNYLNKNALDIASKYGFYRNGGSLRPSTLHMINKILRNENNT